MQELPKHYDHQAAQARCRGIWDAGRFWHAEPPAPGARGRTKIFSIVIPPPNVTGALHLGHALNPGLRLSKHLRVQGDKVLRRLDWHGAPLHVEQAVERTGIVRLVEERAESLLGFCFDLVVLAGEFPGSALKPLAVGAQSSKG